MGVGRASQTVMRCRTCPFGSLFRGHSYNIGSTPGFVGRRGPSNVSSLHSDIADVFTDPVDLELRLHARNVHYCGALRALQPIDLLDVRFLKTNITHKQAQ